MTSTLSVTSILEIHKLSTGARQALLGLLSFRNKETGLCCPRVATLAQRLGTSSRTLFRWMAELRACGILEVKRNGRANFYTFHKCGKPVVENAAYQGKTGDKSGTSDVPILAHQLSFILYEQDSINRQSGVESGCTFSHPTAADRPSSPPPLKTEDQTQTPVKRKAPATARSMTGGRDFCLVRDSLRALAREAGLPPPDDDLVWQAIEAAPGATGEQIHATLVALWKGGHLQKMRGWGFIPLKLGDYYKASA